MWVTRSISVSIHQDHYQSHHNIFFAMTTQIITSVLGAINVFIINAYWYVISNQYVYLHHLDNQIIYCKDNTMVSENVPSTWVLTPSHVKTPRKSRQYIVMLKCLSTNISFFLSMSIQRNQYVSHHHHQ